MSIEHEECDEIAIATTYDDWDFCLANLDDDRSESSSLSLPQQLHPAVTLGMKRISTCYFSIHGSEANSSVADLLSLLGHEDKEELGVLQRHANVGLEVLYDDILMHVFTFLDAESLRQFSETARRQNFECFYFLQLQLQRAMLPCMGGKRQKSLDFNAVSGSGCISRLAKVHPTAAQSILQDYLDSNTTLNKMPLSYSIAYLRHLLARNGFQQHMTSRSPSQALAGAAVLITMIGAASSFMEILDTTTLLQMGLAGSVLASTAMHENSMQRTAEEMASTMQSLSLQMWQQLQKFSQAKTKSSLTLRLDSAFRKEDISRKSDFAICHTSNEHTFNDNEPQLRTPSGCVGAYARAVRSASLHLRTLVRSERQRNFAHLPEVVRDSIAQQFLQACTSDESLPVVQNLVQSRKIIDVDAFFPGPDGVEMCALHVAAYHGACRILEFLVSGLDDNSPDLDGGLANVNIRDSNRWTAMHFCAGGNSVEAVQILARHGAALAEEADNGYTPYHWAQRLSSYEVAAELQRLGADQRFLTRSGPLSAIASRFFARIPSH
jgi:Ankyrin repeats (3 copies)